MPRGWLRRHRARHGNPLAWPAALRTGSSRRSGADFAGPCQTAPSGTIRLTVNGGCSETGGGWRSCPGPTAPGSGQLGAPSIGRVDHVVPSTAVGTAARLLLEASRPQGWRYPPYRLGRRHGGLRRGHLCDGSRSRLTAQPGRQRSRGTRVRGRVISRTVARLTSWRPRNRKPGGLPVPLSSKLRRIGPVPAAPISALRSWRGAGLVADQPPGHDHDGGPVDTVVPGGTGDQSIRNREAPVTEPDLP